MDFEEVYKKWWDLEDCRIRMDLGDGGENLWGKVIGPNLYGINNHPLYAEFQWQDIVNAKIVADEEQLIHRRWNTEVYFCYEVLKDGDLEMDRRRIISDTLREAGCYTGFWVDGLGFAMFLNKMTLEEARAEVTRILEPTNLKIWFGKSEPE